MSLRRFQKILSIHLSSLSFLLLPSISFSHENPSPFFPISLFLAPASYYLPFSFCLFPLGPFLFSWLLQLHQVIYSNSKTQSWDPQLRESMQVFSLWVWVTLLSLIFFGSNQLPENFLTPFNIAEIAIYWAYVLNFHYSFIICRIDSLFHFLAVMNRKAKNLAKPAFAQGAVESFDYMPI